MNLVLHGVMLQKYFKVTLH